MGNAYVALAARATALEEECRLLRLEVGRNKAAEIARTVNQPTSKMAEHEKAKARGPRPLRRRKRRQAKRLGSGNRPKPQPTESNLNLLDVCPECATVLIDEPVADAPGRVVEDIAPPGTATIVVEEICERKRCPKCKKLVAAVADSALPGSDVGVNALILAAYFWVVSCLSLPAIKGALAQFHALTVSTSGLSKMMIRLGNIMAPVYEEVLGDVKTGAIVHADETGWSIGGQLHWLWAFSDKRSAFYWIDRGRGSAVVERILGECLSGCLVTDAWCAYARIACAKQTCMAHLFRKLKKLRETYPELTSLLKFRKKLRRLILDGERLQIARASLTDADFCHKLSLLHVRLEDLLKWPSPNPVLAEMIAKIERQRDNILTFVELDGCPSTNNYGEYTIKKGILKRKVSGGSKSFHGAYAYCVLVTIAQTCHLRGLKFIDFMRASLWHYTRHGRAMKLSEYERSLRSPAMEEAA
jgi:transposase